MNNYPGRFEDRNELPVAGLLLAAVFCELMVFCNRRAKRFMESTDDDEANSIQLNIKQFQWGIKYLFKPPYYR
jgi:hypothetical protein